MKHKQLGFYGAAKKIPRLADNHGELMNEIRALRELDHPHIIRLLQVYNERDFIYLVQELCSGPSLFDRIIENQRLSEQEAARALRHMLKALLCCHVRYIGHYDIKPENFMYKGENRDVLKMIDLGLSGGFKRTDDQVGTQVYSAPDSTQRYIWATGRYLELWCSPVCYGDWEIIFPYGRFRRSRESSER